MPSLLIDIGASVARLEKDVAKANRTIDGFATSVKTALSAIGIGFGASQLKQLFDMGVAASQVSQSFRLMSESANLNGQALLRSMKTASGGTIKETELMSSSVKAMMYDLSAESIVELTKAARTAGRMAGVTTLQAFDEITRAVGTGEAEALKRFGMISKQQLDLFNKAVAAGSKEVSLLDIALANADRQAEKFGTEIESDAERVAALNTRFQELIESISVGFKSAIFGAVDGWKQFGKAAEEAIDPYTELTNAQFAYAKPGAWIPPGGEASTPAMEESRWIGKVPRTPRTSITEIEGKLRAGAGSGKSDKDREEWLREYLSGVDRAMRAEQERSELVGALYMQDWQWTIEKNDRQLKAEQEYFKTLEDIKLAQAEGEAAAREENLAKMKKEQDEMVRFTQRTAEAMQNNFSSLFLDIMQGKLEGFKSFAVRIFQSIQEAAADYLGQIATEFLFGTLMKTGGGGGGGLFGSLLGLFGGGAAAGGGMASAAATSAMFAMMLHEGGTVGSDGIAKLMPAGYFAGAPRLHGGLAADEYPAILQRGEKVIPAQGNASGEAGGRSIIVNINAIDSASLAETMARNPSAIISPFLTALNQGGQVRNALKNVM